MSSISFCWKRSRLRSENGIESLLNKNLSRKSNHTKSNNSSGTSTSWERGAKLVKATDKTNKYLDHIRESHDPSLHLKTLEDELKGTMSKALGNQGEKVLKLLQNLHQERARYEDILALHHKSALKQGNSSDNELNLDNLTSDEKLSLFTIVQKHNRLRTDALNARWELLVHRQAVGFITNNHKFVHEKFPVPESLKLPGNEKDWKEFQDDKSLPSGARVTPNVTKEAVTRNFGDQLDWWERIGRWR